MVGGPGRLAVLAAVLAMPACRGGDAHGGSGGTGSQGGQSAIGGQPASASGGAGGHAPGGESGAGGGAGGSSSATGGQGGAASSGQGGGAGTGNTGLAGQTGRGGDGGSAGAAPPGEWQGTRQLGSTSPDYAAGLAVDSSSAVYVTAMTYNGVFDGNASIGSNDILLFKLDRAGNKQWSRELGTAGADDPSGVAVDRSGNVYLTGYTLGGLDGNINLGESDLFLFKFDPNGNKLWSIQVGTSKTELAGDVVVDKAGFVYVGGNTFGPLAPGQPADTRDDCFLAKFDGAGVVVWIKQFGSPTCGHVADVATDGEGHPYLVGSVYAKNSGTDSDLFVVKFDDQGAMLWTRTLGSDQPESAYGVATDAAGNVYVAGDTVGGLDGNVSAGDGDAFVVKYDGAGAKQWTRQVGTDRRDVGASVIVDAQGGVYLAGYTEGGLDGNANSGLSDLFLIKYDGAGTKQWLRQLGTTGYDYPADMSLDPSGGVFIAGTTTGSLDGNKNVGLWDVFVTKYTASGAIARAGTQQ